jgi:hypothetical protein
MREKYDLISYILTKASVQGSDQVDTVDVLETG